MKSERVARNASERSLLQCSYKQREEGLPSSNPATCDSDANDVCGFLGNVSFTADGSLCLLSLASTALSG